MDHQLRERIEALERLAEEQRRRIDELESENGDQQRLIDALLGSKADSPDGERAGSREVTVIAGPLTKRLTKRVEISVTVDLSLFDKNVVIHIASYLCTMDLVNLGRTCGKFGRIQGGESRSLANEAARQMFADATGEERRALPRYDGESDISLLRELCSLRAPLSFGQLLGKHISHTSMAPCGRTHYCGGLTGGAAGASNCVTNALPPALQFSACTAMCGHTMRGGRHFAEFHMRADEEDWVTMIGVIRPLPGWDARGIGSFAPVAVEASKGHLSRDLLAERTPRWGEGDVHCCAYYCYDGECWCTDWVATNAGEEWEGQEAIRDVGTIGILLDLDRGTLVVYKNGRRLGTMKSGLSGEYCFYACMNCNSTISIERGALPLDYED